MRKLMIFTFFLFTITLSSCSPQPKWTLLHPSSNPPPLAQSGFAYNTNSNEGLVFGGIYSDKWSDDTWIWNGIDWRKADTKNKPPAREKVAITYDEARDMIVMFGGSMDKTVFGDTWEWNGNDWRLVKPIHNPPARCCHAMAYDSVLKKVLLYGGWNSVTGEFFNDTWVWDGKDWTELPYTGAPLAAAHTLVNFASRGTLISTPSGFNNTWEWDSKMWSEINSSITPNRADSRSVYDSQYERIIAFGGISDGTLFLNDTWIFDGHKWDLINALSAPPARYSHIMFYDTKRNSIILFGGVGNSGLLNDTWEFVLPKDLSSAITSTTPTP